MKIQNSSIYMASSHHESSFTHQETMTVEANAAKNLSAVILSLSSEKEGRSYYQSLEEYERRQEEEQEKRNKQNEARNAKQMVKQFEEMRKTQSNQFEFTDEYQQKIKMMKKLFDLMLGRRKIGEENLKEENGKKYLDLRSASSRNGEFSISGSAYTGVSSTSSASLGIGLSASDTGSQLGLSTSDTGLSAIGTGLQLGSGSTWEKITVSSGIHTESESTTFATNGIVNTADGRSLSFQMEVSMSRAFISQFDVLEKTSYIKTDPLMINLDTNVGSVSDQKFYFDLNSDGEEEKISFAGQGSGFLALDKNGDGKIGDGSELFGTKSGDCFKDLAEYDEDGNGFIDENDSVFSKLLVWTKDKDGKDILLNLKQADVGAIYLGNAETQFSLKNEQNQLNGEIRKTGIYLKESTGEVGTINHVDLVL